MKKNESNKFARKTIRFLGVAVVILLAIALLVRSRKPISGKKLATNDAAQIAIVYAGEAYVYDLSTETIIQLTQSGNAIRDAAWSPDGSYLALRYYKSEFGENAIDTLYRLDVTNGKLLSLTPSGSPGCEWLRWSPDGKTIACGTGIDPDDEILLVQTDGSGVKSLTRGMMPFWSADGKRLIYVFIRETPTAKYDPAIAAFNIQTGAVSVLLEVEGYEAFPQWSPDGKMIAYYLSDTVPWGVSGSQSDASTEENFPRLSLYVWDGSSTILVADNVNHNTFYNNIRYRWSPDNATLFFENCEYAFTSGKTSCRGSSNVYTSMFSPDGEQILQVDTYKRKLCVIPLQSDCVKFPEEWKAPAQRVIGWRPQP